MYDPNITKRNVRLTTINIALMAMLVTALVSVGWRQVGAQEDGEPKTPAGQTEEGQSDENHDCDIDFEDWEDLEAYGYVDVAKLIGIDEETYWSELDTGKTIAELATANGVDPQTIIDAMVAEEKTFYDEMVAAGDLTAEEAAEWLAESEKYAAYEVNNGYSDPFAAGLKLIGIDEETLWAEVDAGKSIAQIAQEKGVDPQAVIDAVVAAENAEIDKQIAAGLLTEEEAAEWRAEIEKYVADSINLTPEELEAQWEAEFAEFDEEFDFDFDDVEMEESEGTGNTDE